MFAQDALCSCTVAICHTGVALAGWGWRKRHPHVTRRGNERITSTDQVDGSAIITRGTVTMKRRVRKRDGGERNRRRTESEREEHVKVIYARNWVSCRLGCVHSKQGMINIKWFAHKVALFVTKKDDSLSELCYAVSRSAVCGGRKVADSSQL
eukprot:IDg12176t1